MSARPSHLGVALTLALLGLPACGPCEGPGELVIDLDDLVIPATMDLRGIVRIESGYLAVGTGGAIVRRTSFSDWAAVESPTAADLLAVDHWGPRVLAVGRAGTLVQSEDDGLSFALVELGISEDLHAVLLDGQRGVMVGDDRIAWSSDGGDSWALASLPAGSFSLRGVADDGEALWAVGLAGAMLRSDDAGASWSEIAAPVQQDLWAIGYAGIDAEAGLFAVGDAGTILRLESSGWVSVEHEIEGDLRGVGGNFMVGVDGLVVAIEVDYASEPQRYQELGREPARGDLWDVVDELAVGDGSRLTTIGIDWVSSDPNPFCEG
jgi:photosystem II stability/assembly factor-like uncharacterized protein